MEKMRIFLSVIILLCLTSISWSSYNTANIDDLQTRITEIDVESGLREYFDNANATSFWFSLKITGEVYNPNPHLLKIKDYNNCTDHAIDGFVANYSFLNNHGAHYNFLGCNPDKVGYKSISYKPGLNEIKRLSAFRLNIYGNVTLDDISGNISLILKSRYYDIEGFIAMITIQGRSYNNQFDTIPKSWGNNKNPVLYKIRFMIWTAPLSVILAIIIVRIYSFLQSNYKMRKVT